jgi:cellulose synthase (UDP-forming)
VTVGVWRLLQPDAATETLWLNMGWTAYNLLILGAAIRVAAESQQRRLHVRVDMHVPLLVRPAPSPQQPEPDYEIGETVDMSYGGLSYLSLGLIDLEHGSPVEVALLPERKVLWLPGIIRRIDDTRVAIQFSEMTLEQQSYLVYVLYGRADSWLAWRKEETRDRPWKALAHVAQFGWQGAAIALASMAQRLRGAKHV